MRRRSRIPLLVCGIALALAGCGSSNNGTIPNQEASELLALLDTLRSNVDQGICEQVPGTAQEFVTRVNNLPSDVDPAVRSELTKAAANLDQLAADPSQCTQTGTSDTGGVTSSTTSTTESVPTTTESTTTTTEETTTTDQTGGGNQNQGNGQTESPPPETPNPAGGGGGGVEPPSGGVTPGGRAGAK